MKRMTQIKQRGLIAFILLFWLAIPLTFAQERINVSGTIVDEMNEPMIGVNVIEKGTTNGVMSDIDGKYSLSVSRGATIVYSYIGYISQEQRAVSSVINITLKEDNQALDEVIVIGYGVQRKSDVTGAVSQVKAADLENRSVSTVGHALQGKTAGVNILQTSGAPGAGTSIRIRGYSSNDTSEPLYIVDGLTVSDINYLDPENVESLEVLKDAASAAIYGAQAGNGVVLITTKTGANNSRGRVFYNMQYSSSKVGNIPDVMNASQWSEYMVEGGFASQTSIDDYWYTYKNGTRANTRWSDYVFDTGSLVRNTVGFEGGNDKGSLYIALSSINNNGVVIGDKDTYNRTTAQVNADYKIKPWLKVGMTNSIERYKSKSVRENSEVYGMIASAILYDPITPYTYEMDNLPTHIATPHSQGKPFLKDNDGNIYGTSPYATSQIWHPMQMRDTRDTKSDGINTNGTFYADITPIKGLVVTSRFGYRYSYGNTSTYVSPYYVLSTNEQNNGTLEARSSNSLFYQWENFANYSFSLGKNSFTAMAGMSYQKNKTNYLNVSTDLLTNEADNYRYVDYSSTSANDRVTGAPNDRVNMAYFGRLSWSYDNRYNLQANFRADAFDASKLSKDSRWGYFPSVSAGWTISNESFMKEVNQDALSSLKLRASWGKNGNVNILNNYEYATTVGSSYTYDFTNTSGSTIGVAPSNRLPNPKLKWEESEQYDVGLDARFLRSRLSFTYDFYHKETNGLLTTTTPAMTTGASSMYVNAGNVRNMGHEFELSWKDQIKDFSYSISANLATVDNKVIKGPSTERLNGANLQSFGTITYFEEGYPVWYFRTYQVDHIDKETGSTMYKKADGSVGTYADVTDDDRAYTGSGIPDFTYGITINMAYKGFDFTIFGSGSQGGKIFQAYYRTDLPVVNRLSYLYTDRWTPSNTNASVPKPNVADTKYWGSDAMLFDASYFKIRQIQLGYTIPQTYLKKLGLAALRAYVSLDNFFTFTSYKGIDPETRSSSTSGIGIDRMSFPTSKNVAFGLNLSF
ncbi:TonB-dependent receptor [Parabacteroides sp. PF5-9]|uniref:SusC/RagA family TonB-linked outer membrane protein n=1 Tax=Parabacteroides sp. PF5-9 TaxID=1742404 RepID=UPI00247573F8|nr:TonB-dependent receptor [Parabacteroides sp. PF5-9]MDH6357931.1 TonB-linked SusC/RagA family outer membrane protein [Parabacteroides sp. PF5-9]